MLKALHDIHNRLFAEAFMNNVTTSVWQRMSLISLIRLVVHASCIKKRFSFQMTSSSRECLPASLLLWQSVEMEMSKIYEQHN
jgi:isocitrate dehydrogenase kinase/phosphatase